MNEVNYSHYEDAYDTRQRYLNQKLLPVKEKYRISFKIKEDGIFFFKNDEERRSRIRSILGIQTSVDNELYWGNNFTWENSTCGSVTYEDLISFAKGN